MYFVLPPYVSSTTVIIPVMQTNAIVTIMCTHLCKALSQNFIRDPILHQNNRSTYSAHVMNEEAEIYLHS